MTIHIKLTMTPENVCRDDLPQLKALWAEAFGSADVDVFFENWFSPSHTVACKAEGNITAAAYILPAGELINDDSKLPFAMIYGVATKKEYQNHGLGAFVTDAAAERAAGLGYQICALCPASDGLFEYYKKRTSFRREYFIEQTTCTAAVQEMQSAYELKNVTASEYRTLRREFLQGRVYLDLSEKLLRYQNGFSGGNGLVKICRDGECIGTAVLERQDSGEMWIKELLCRVDREQVLAELSKSTYSGNCTARYPVTQSGADMRRFMLTPETDIPQDAWFGLALD